MADRVLWAFLRGRAQSENEERRGLLAAFEPSRSAPPEWCVKCAAVLGLIVEGCYVLHIFLLYRIAWGLQDESSLCVMNLRWAFFLMTAHHIFSVCACILDFWDVGDDICVSLSDLVGSGGCDYRCAASTIKVILAVFAIIFTFKPFDGVATPGCLQLYHALLVFFIIVAACSILLCVLLAFATCRRVDEQTATFRPAPNLEI